MIQALGVYRDIQLQGDEQNLYFHSGHKTSSDNTPLSLSCVLEQELVAHRSLQTWLHFNPQSCEQ